MAVKKKKIWCQNLKPLKRRLKSLSPFSITENVLADCFPANSGTSQLKQWEELLG